MNLGNFLLSSNWTLKISDFGATKQLTETIFKKSITKTPGAPYYLSPEVSTGYYNYSCDVWSFGLIVADFCSLPQVIGDIPPTPLDQILNEFNRLSETLGDEDGKRVLYWLKNGSFSHRQLVEYMLRRENAMGLIKKYSVSLEKISKPCLYFETEEFKGRPSFDDLKNQLVELQQSNQWDPQITKMPTNTLEEFLT